MPTRPKPFKYQADGREWLQSGPHRFLGDEPGLGKSRQLIEASRGSTLVTAPAMVLDGGTWNEELALWADDPSRFTQASYSGLNTRIKTGKTASSTAPTDDLRPEYREPVDTLIIDEAQYIKGRKSHWTQAIKKIRAERVFLASGTAIPNWADELFIPLQLLYPDETSPGQRFGAYWRWAGQWFDTAPTRWSQGKPQVGELLACGPSCLERPPTNPCDHYLEFYAGTLGENFLMRFRDDVLTDLPPLTVQRVQTPMGTAQAKLYKQLKRDFIAWSDTNGSEVVAWNAAAQNEILSKLCVGAECIPHLEVASSGKLEMLRWDLAARPVGRPTLVMAHHQDVLEAARVHVTEPLGLRAEVVHGGTSRPARASIVAAFKAGELDVLLGSLETVAEGLTLTQADMCILLEKSYKPSRNQQAIRRIHRLGQTRPVSIREYITPDTVDERKEALLAVKTDRQMRHLSAAQFARLL